MRTAQLYLQEKRLEDAPVRFDIIEVLPEGHYVILGDNCVAKEYDTTDDDIIGIMTGFERGGKTYTVNHPIYRIYARLRVWLAPIRITRKKAVAKLRRLVKKLIR